MHVVKCPLSAPQAAMYDWIKATGARREDPAHPTRANLRHSWLPVTNKVIELRKVCNHPLMVYPEEERFMGDGVVTSCGKMFWLDRLLVKLFHTGHRVLLFSTMTRLLDLVESYLRWRKVTRLGDADNRTTGFVLVFYDVTQVVSQAQEASATAEVSGNNLRLTRIPVVSNQQVVFVDADDVLCLESQAHYTRVLTRQGYHFCNLSIGDLHTRLDPARFMRVHRCFIVNLQGVSGLGREGSKTTWLVKGGREPIPVSRNALATLREALGLSSRH